MRVASSASMLIVLLVLVGCASTPRPSSYPSSYANNLQAAYHWELLAKDVVATQVLPVTSKDPETKIYVDNSDRTEFGKAFHNYIVTDLINHGIQPAPGSNGATAVRWGTQLVWNDKRGSRFPGIFMGALEAVGWLLAGGDTPDSVIEAVVITQVERGSVILSRQSHNFYLNEGNKGNFLQPAAVPAAVLSDAGTFRPANPGPVSEALLGGDPLAISGGSGSN